MPSIVAMTNGSPHSWIVINAVVARFGPIAVLVEDKQAKGPLLRSRIKRHGFLMASGQAGFTLLQRLIERRSRARVAAILAREGLDPSPNPSCEVIRIGSVNSEACRQALARLDPDAVFVIGTRIIGRETLAAVKAPLMNLHAGIAPKYRGQAGGYWALAKGDLEHAGVTVHLVDAGVDTGAVVGQAPFRPEKGDTFSTYFYLQAAAFRPLILKALEDALEGKLRTHKPDLPSAQFYHPTLWGYLWTGLAEGVW